MQNFSLKYYTKLNCINVNSKFKDLHGNISLKSLIVNNKKTMKKYPNLKETDVLSYPVTHQFRVNVCTELYHKDVPLQYINQYMAHLSSDMQDYYVRPKKSYQENVIYSKEVLKDIITGESKLLGKNTESLNLKIKEFIEKGKFNIAKDLDEIIDNLIKKIPIREKLGGICIKSSMLRDCSKDSKTDEFYCSYGICPNHFHLFYMADITFERYLSLKKTYSYNKDNGFFRQSEKEKYKLINLIKEMLLPELDELKIEINKKGKNQIISKYKKLTYIINNYDDIYKAVSSKAGIGHAIDYVTKKEKTEEKLVSGLHCEPETVKEEMQATKELWGKTDGRTYKHYVQSYHEDEEITPEQAHKNAVELAEHTKAWKGHEVLIATHIDKGHIHTHFIVNSVNYENGHKLQWM